MSAVAKQDKAAELVRLVPDLALTFGAVDGAEVKTIAYIVQNFKFDPSNINVREKSRDNFLHTGLAPSFGTLTKESFKGMDEQLKILIAAANKELEQMPAEDRTWDNVISVFKNNEYFEPIETPEGSIDRPSKLIKTSESVFQFKREFDEGTVHEVEEWFTNLIQDEDVLKSTKIDIKVLADIVATTGAVIEDIATFIRRNEYHEKTVVDIGVLRYPDIEHPYFKVFRIQLTAWSETKHIVIVNEDSNGITGQYNMQLFKPREDIIAGIKAKTRKEALAEADAMFA
ncbi:hypothetical protein SCHPADRAFT_947134 [Schizopora paradoxa]|uniref:Uncharacterized protein n=1 Tax=Schizopora paradoxa TaxID=27342 RepID=A0A0H2R6Q2_9AGAM|nr:hypothetical protein SCHPADRAFT_947134 [Schizopora paradoxa]